MASFGSLLFYSRNGVSDPFLLSYGKTFIGSSDSSHIRIKGEGGQISCILDSNEVGVTILVNENEDKSVVINNVPTSKYAVMKDGDQLEIGKKRFLYSNPSLKEEYLEQTQETLNKKVGTVGNFRTKSDNRTNSLTLSKRVQRRFSTGSKVAVARNSPRNIGKSPLLSGHVNTSHSPSRLRFSRRMIARRNSTLASVMENEVFDIDSPNVTPAGKTNPRVSFLASLRSPSAKKNKTFSGTSKFSSPVPPKNKTYSGNVSDVSENITTPENSIAVASITPLNVSKKNKSMNKSRTLSYVDILSSSTPKSAIRNNRSTSLYRPVVEDITPASPLARSSLRDSSIKKLAFTQRRSVNFNISSSSDRSSAQNSGLVNLSDLYPAGSKRKRSSISSMPESPENVKRSKRTSSKQINSFEHQKNLHDPNISIQNFSVTNSNKNGSTNILTPGKLQTDTSCKESDSEHQSIVSWNEEMPMTDMNLSGLSECSSIAKTPLKIKRSTRLSNLNSASSGKKIDIDSRSSSGVETPPQEDCSDSDRISLRLTRSNTSQDSNLDDYQSPKRPSANVSISNIESVLDDSLEDSESSRSTRSLTKERGRVKARSKSLNLRKEDKKSKDILSKTLDINLAFNISEQKNLRNVSSTPTVRTESRKSAFPKSRSKSLNLRNIRSNSLHVPLKTSTSMTLNFSPIKSTSSKFELSNKNVLNETESSGSNSVLDDSTSNTNLSRYMEIYKVEDSTTPGNTKRKSTRKTPIATNSEMDSDQPGVLGGNSAKYSPSKTPNRSLNAQKSDSSVSSGIGLTSRSKVTCEYASDFSTVSNDISPCNSSVNSVTSDRTNSVTLEVLFKTPNAKRALRKLETPNLSFTSTNDPTDVRSAAKLLQGSFEKSSRRSSRSSNLAETSLAALDDRSLAETSLSRSWKFVESENIKPLRISSPKNRSVQVASAKLSSRNSKSMTKQQKTPKNDLTDISGVEELLKTPKNNPSNILTEKKMIANPEVQKSPNTNGTPRVQNSPKNDLSIGGSSKKLLRTPKVQKPPKNDLSDVGGVKKMMKTPKVQKTPKNDLSDVRGLKQLLKTPKTLKSPKNDITNVQGVAKLMKTPRVIKSPKNDLSNVKGLKKLMKTPKAQRTPKNDLTNVRGLKKLMKTPKVQRSPKNDLSNIGGVKKLMKTPKVQRSPKNDLTNIGGVKKLMKTPKVQRSPKNDLTNVGGVKKLMKTPKIQRSPKNDLTNVGGVKKFMKTPKVQRSPKNDLTNVGGVKKLMKTPIAQKSPKNDLTDVRGVRNLLRTPKNKADDESYNVSGIDCLFNESKESNFDKLIDKKPLRTYGRSPKINKSQEDKLNEPETPEHVLKWLEEQSKLETVIKVESSKRGKRKLKQSLDTEEENIVNSNKRQKVIRSTRLAHKNQDASMLNISASIIGKPSSTPVKSEKTTKQGSRAEISENNSQTNTNNEEQVETRSLRGKRKAKINDMEPSSKKTRETKSSKNMSKSNNTNEIEIASPVAKRSVKTRQMKHKDDPVEKLPEQTNTRKQRNRKEIEVSKDIIIHENAEECEEKQPTKRTRSKKESEKKISVEDENKDIKKNTRSKRGKVQEEIVTISEQEPKTRGRRIKKVEEVLDIEPKATKRGKANTQTETVEESVEIENKSGTKKVGKNSRKKAQENKPPTKKNTRQKEIEDENSEENDQKPTRSNRGKNKKYNEEEWDTPVKKDTKKQTVTFKDDVEYSKTPVQSTKEVSRRLRKRI